jgi:mannose-6-phosphate isomerase-like protein (cupin superfamily)
MGTKIKQMVTHGYTGDRVHGERPAMVEIDEEEEVLGCSETFDRQAVHARPLKILKVDLAGDTLNRRIPVLVNDDVRIELATDREAADHDFQRSDGWHEVHVQVESATTSRTTAGEYPMKPSDLLVVPAGVSHRSAADEGGTRLIVSTRRPLRVADGYPAEENSPGAGDRPTEGCIHLRPSKAADAADESVSGGKHFELVVNEDIMIETTFRSDDQRVYHRGYDQDEVHFQLSGRRATRTSQGEFMLETGDMLLIPPGVTHRNIGGMPTIRIVLYTRKPLGVADEYVERLGDAWGS